MRAILFFALMLFVATLFGQGSIDWNNSTRSAPLGAGGAFVGAWEDVQDYAEITVVYNTDQEGTLNLEFSIDKAEVDFVVPHPAVFDGTLSAYSSVVSHWPAARYFRVNFVNGATPQTKLRLQTMYHKHKHISSDSVAVISITDTTIVSVIDTTVVLVTDTTVVKLNTNAENYFFWNLHRGNIPGARIDHVTGVNDSIGTSPIEKLWAMSDGYIFREDVVYLRVAAGGNSQDSVGNTGAWSIELTYLDTNWVEVIDTLILDGPNISIDSTITPAIRLNGARVLGSGGYNNTNLGPIVIEEADSGDPVGYIDSLQGSTQQAIYSCPAGYSCYMTNITLQVTGTTSANVNLFVRENADDFTAPYKSPESVLRYFSLGGGSDVTIDSDEIIPFPAKSDVYWEVYSNSGNASATVSFDVILITP